MNMILDSEKTALYAKILSQQYAEEITLDVLPVLEKPDTECSDNTAHILNENWLPFDDSTEFLHYQNQLILRNLIKLGADEVPNWLVLFVTNSTQETSHNMGQLVECLNTIRQLILSDYTQTITLNGMAHELAVRYEELNVLYGIEAFSNNFHDKNSSDESILKQLAESCLDYLPVNLISIIVPEDNLSVQYSDSMETQEVNLITSYLSNEIFDRFEFNNETWVINRNEITDWIDCNEILPYKFIISPITSTDKNVTGLFVLVNQLDSDDFTNSDRKLSDVLASEISNVLSNKRDKLTGFLNRSGLISQIRKVFDSPDKTKEEYKATDKQQYLLQMNIDNFKMVNDTAGLSVGDNLLKQIATLLKINIKNNTTIARTGIDEFTLLFEEIDEEQVLNSAKTIKKIIHDLNFYEKDRYFNITLTISIMKLDNNETNPDNILKTLEMTCRSAKLTGGNQIVTYDPDNEKYKQQHKIIHSANKVNESLQNNRLILYGQQISPGNKSDDNHMHYEVLVRMLDEENNIIPPGLFIPAAEQYKMMMQLDLWVLDNSLLQLQEWMKNYNTDIVLSINISGQSIGDERFSTIVYKKIKDSGVKAKFLCFEITETAAVVNLTQALNFIDKMGSLGCSFALDDFGAGMSSFNYLKNIPIDYLKIDGCFVKNINNDKIDYAMVESINNIGHVMQLKTVAEFVEDETINRTLNELGVDYLQGYYIHKPEPLSNIIQPDLKTSILITAAM